MGTEDDELRSRAQARIGSTLRDKYRLDRILGIGGMAVVYAATHRNRNRVAVKILHAELALDSSLRSRFAREGYVANTVEHPGTVRVLDDDVAEDGAAFLVMELLDGETLDARWEQNGRRLGARDVAILMRDLLDVLAAAHAKGVVHRDIKPENLFLTREGVLKVLDFGVARLRSTAPTATQSDRVFGTPAFMPPEQALGRVSEVDAISDVWAVGATAFTLLSGSLVHEGQTAEEVLVNSATKPARSLASLAPNIPPSLAAVVERALAFEKTKRWPSARAMQEALSTLLEDPGAFRAGDGGALDWEDDMTRVTAPPQMTVSRSAAPLAESLQAAESPSAQPMPVLPVSTVAGVASHSVARRVRTRFALMIGACVVGFVLTIVVAGSRMRMGSPSVAPLAIEASPSVAIAQANPAGNVSDASRVAEPVVPVVQVESLPRAPTATVALPAVSPVIARGPLPPPMKADSPLPSPLPSPSPTSSPTPPPASAARSAAKAGCDPAFVVDSNGVKRWKIECL